MSTQAAGKKPLKPRKKRHFSSVVSQFCRQKTRRYILSLQAFFRGQPRVFYHASNIEGLKELLPLSTLHNSGEKVCYITPVREYALFYLRDMVVNHVTCGVSKDGIVIYDEQFPNQLEKIYRGRSGYLYECSDDDRVSEGHAKGVWVLRRPVSISGVERVEDVYTEIICAERAGRVRVNRYETLSDARKTEIDEMMKDYIADSGFLTEDSPKARFFAENFPRAWGLAEMCNREEEIDDQ